MSCNNARFNEEGRYNCRVSGDECIYLIPNKERCYKDGYINMEIKVMKSDGYEWYKDCIDKKFIVQSESKKGGKGKYVVRLNKEDRHLMNGYNYGWISKEHCRVI